MSANGFISVDFGSQVHEYCLANAPRTEPDNDQGDIVDSCNPCHNLCTRDIILAKLTDKYDEDNRLTASHIVGNRK